MKSIKLTSYSVNPHTSKILKIGDKVKWLQRGLNRYLEGKIVEITMNKDFRLSVSFLEHWKTIILQEELGSDAVLCLLKLWAFTAQNKPDGGETVSARLPR